MIGIGADDIFIGRIMLLNIVEESAQFAIHHFDAMRIVVAVDIVVRQAHGNIVSRHDARMLPRDMRLRLQR